MLAKTLIFPNGYNYLPPEAIICSSRSLISSLSVHVCGHIYLPFIGCSVKLFLYCLNLIDESPLHVLKSVHREAREAAAIQLWFHGCPLSVHVNELSLWKPCHRGLTPTLKLYSCCRAIAFPHIITWGYSSWAHYERICNRFITRQAK